MALSKRSGLAPLLSLVSLLLVFFAQPTLAVYKDEAFNVDFAHTLVSTPIRHNTFFHRPNTVSKATLLYTLGEKGVLGAINPRDGETVWRALVNDTLPSADGYGEGILRAHESSTTVVTAFGPTVRAWDAKDGRLVWEVPVEHKVKSLELIGPDAGQVDVVVLTEGEGDAAGSVYRLAGGDGTVHWKQPGAATSDQPLGVSVAALKLFVTSLSPAGKAGFKAKIRSIDPATGKELSQYTLSTEADISSEASILHLSGVTAAPGLLAWTDKKGRAHVNVLGSKQTTTAALGQGNVNGELTGISLVESAAAGPSPSFLLQYNWAEDHLAEVYRIDVSAGRADKAFELPKIAGGGSFSASTIDDATFYIRYTESETLLYSSKDSTVLEQWPGRRDALSASSASVLHSASELAPKGDGHYSVRTAVVTSDGDWQLYQNGAHAWTRYEGLSGIVAAAYVDIPPERSLIEALSAESHSNIVSAYIHRVQRHLKDLRHLPAWLQTIPARLISSATGIDITDTPDPLAPDEFGFKKIILVATAKGRVAALGTANRGQVLWSRQVSRNLGNSKDSWDVRRIDVQGTTAHVLAADGEFVLIDGILGNIIQHSPRTQGVSYYAPVPGPEGRSSLLAISADGQPGILPDGFPSSSHIVTQAADGSVNGWKPTANGKSALVWSFSPKPGETVNSVSTRPAHDPVASIGRARGDRNVLYKFLSPNLALVTASSILLSTISVYLLDTVSGQLLYSATHESVDASLTVPVTLSENWFAYSIFSDVSRDVSSGVGPETPQVKGHQLIVSELFESPFPNDRGPLGTAQNYSSLSDGYKPYVESSAVIIPAPVTVLSTTSTLQGITPRSLLAYSPALAALISLPIPFLSPLRPVGREPDASEREEGLMRYQANLDFAPTWYLSHQRELLGIRQTISTATNMESSALVFAFGDLDVFGTRVAPIGTFDILGEGFGKGQLVLTVVGLAVGTSFLAPMARRRAIDNLWKS